MKRHVKRLPFKQDNIPGNSEKYTKTVSGKATIADLPWDVFVFRFRLLDIK